MISNFCSTQGIRQSINTGHQGKSRSPPRSPIITRSMSAAMGDEHSHQTVSNQDNPRMVPIEEHLALKRDMEALQTMVNGLLASQAQYRQHYGPSSSQIHHQPGPGGFVFQESPSAQNNTGLLQGLGISQENPQGQAQRIPIIPVIPQQQEDAESQHEDAHPNSACKEEDSALAQKIQHLEEALRAMQGPNAYTPTSFSDLCFFPDLQLPPKFKMPDFSKFDGTTDPMTHLRLYAGALCGYPNPDKLMMQLFQHSLTGQAAQWFARLDIRRFKSWAELSQEFLKQYRHNTQLVIDRFSLERTKKEDNESFRAYALRWKDLASQVNPPLQDSEYSRTFVQTLKGVYFERLCTSIGHPFAEIIQQGEIIEDGIKTGKIMDPYAKVGEGLTSSSYSQPKRTPPPKKGKEPEVAAVIPFDNRNTHANRNPHQITYQQPYPHTYPAYPSPPYQTSPYPNTMYRPPTYQNATYPPTALPNYPSPYSQNQANDQRRNPPRKREFTAIAIPMAEVLNRLMASGHLTPIPAKPLSYPLPPAHRPDAKCAYHSGQAGHDTEQCWTLRNKVQDLIDSRSIKLEETAAPNVTTNPLPNHQVNMITKEKEAWDSYPQRFIGPPGTVVVFSKTSEAPLIAMTGRSSGGRGRGSYRQNLGSGYYTRYQPPSYLDNIPTLPIQAPKQAITLPIHPIVTLPRTKLHPNFDPHHVPWTYPSSSKVTQQAITAQEEPVGEIGGITRSGRVYTHAELESQKKKKEKEKAVLTEHEVAQFIKVLKASEYDVVEQLKKTPAHINILSLLLTSEPHRDALLDILKDAQVPKDMSPDHFHTMVASVMSPGVISFSDEEIPEEGIGHTKALHIAVKTKGMIVARVLIDNGSALNVCPYSTLERLGMDESYLHYSGMVVRAFDGSRRETMGEIELPVEIGSITFSIRFQVLKIPAAYNLLLGRPWIHVTGGIASSLHQKIKFLIDEKIITIFAEPDFAIYSAPAIPFIESTEPSSYQTLEYVSAIQGSPPSPKFSEIGNAVAKYFHANGYQPGKGLGKSLQGEIKFRDVPTQTHTFGLGYQPSSREQREAAARKREARSGYYYEKVSKLPPITFVHGGFEGPSKEEVNVVPMAGVENEEVQIPLEGLVDLFAEMEVHVIGASGISTDVGDSLAGTIRPAYPGEKLLNWTAEPIHRARKFW